MSGIQSEATKRLLRDFASLQKSTDDSVMASPQENNLFVWDCVIFGPPNTPWEGGCFKFTMTFSEEYPRKPPTVLMETFVFHPNFYVDGRICLDILKNQWSPANDVYSILISIQSLLTDPNPNSPANAEAAKLFNNNREEYYAKVKECVIKSINDCNDL